MEAISPRAFFLLTLPLAQNSSVKAWRVVPAVLVLAALVLLYCKAVYADDAPYVADSVADDSGGSGSTAAERLEEFCQHYAMCRRITTADDRMAAARRISRSNLTFAEKAWLLYELVDPEQSFQEVESVAACSAGGFSMVIGWIRDDSFTNGLSVSSSAIDGSQRTVELEIEVDNEYPNGRAVGIYSFGRSDDSASEESDSGGEPPPELEGPEKSFCELYGRCISAVAARERLELGEFVRRSDLSESEKAWLLFNLTQLGISAEEAHRILGGDSSLEKSWQAFIPDMPTERSIDLRSYKQTGLYRPARYYSWGISVLLTEDESHVESVRLGLKKSSSDVIRGEDVWPELFPEDDANSENHPPPEPKPDE